MSIEDLRKQLRENHAKLSKEQSEAPFWVVKPGQHAHSGIHLLISMAASIGAFIGFSTTRDGRTVKVIVKLGKHEIDEYVNLELSAEQPAVRTIVEKVVQYCPKDVEARFEAWYDRVYHP